MNFQLDVATELSRARSLHPEKQNSLHEGHSVLLEEVDEFWEQVCLKKPAAIDVYEELVQIAAMAQRTAEDVLRDKKGFDTTDAWLSPVIVIINARREEVRGWLTHGRICELAGMTPHARVSYGPETTRLEHGQQVKPSEGLIIHCTDTIPV